MIIMRIAEYIVAGVVIAVFVIFFLFVYSVVNGALDMVFDEFNISLPDYMDIALRWTLVIAGGGFIAYVIFDYVYDIIVGEE